MNGRIKRVFLVKKTSNNKPFKIPRANKILKGYEGKRYKGPTMKLTTIEHDVTFEGEKSTTSILPSEPLKLSMANPHEAEFFSVLPDRTSNVSKGLTTGTKRLNHPALQHPQVSVQHKDLWVGDLVKPCRKRYYKKPIRKRYQTLSRSTLTLDQLNKSYPKRTSAEDLSFKNTRSDAALFKLSSYNPSQDTAIEALHFISLGVVRYLIEHLVQVVVLGGKSKEQKIS